MLGSALFLMCDCATSSIPFSADYKSTQGKYVHLFQICRFGQAAIMRGMYSVVIMVKEPLMDKMKLYHSHRIFFY